MSDELDPTTARLVSELAASMLPELTKSLNTAIPANDFSGALERITRTSQDLRTQIDKAIRSGIDENRAGRSMMMQSLGNMLEEISSLKRSIEKIPANIKPVQEVKQDNNTEKLEHKLEEISGLMNELIEGIGNLAQSRPVITSETPESSQVLYESDRRLDKMLTTTLPALEGLVKAEGKAHTHELEEFSREISTLHEQNNIALIKEVREASGHELKKFAEEMMNQIDAERMNQTAQTAKMFRAMMIASGINILLLIAAIVIIFLK